LAKLTVPQNQIKAQAREHERFRKVCVSMAQALHRFDMRLRLGSIRNDAAIRKQAEATAEAKKHIPTSPTVKTEAATKAEEEALLKAKTAAEEAAKPQHYRIRPLSESKAIESGANFISESFLFLVAGGLIVFESWRSRRKESTRREGVEDRLAELEQSEKTAREALVALEKELLALKAKHGDLPKASHRILPREVYEVVPEVEEPEVPATWWTRITSYIPFGQASQPSAPDAAPTPKETKPATEKSAVPVQTSLRNGMS
jgi:optic atrophy 3 protein